MQHPGMNAEIARLAHTEALRRTRHVHDVASVDHVESQKPSAFAGIVGRLTARLVPELGLAAPRGAFQ